MDIRRMNVKISICSLRSLFIPAQGQALFISHSGYRLGSVLLCCSCWFRLPLFLWREVSLLWPWPWSCRSAQRSRIAPSVYSTHMYWPIMQYYIHFRILFLILSIPSWETFSTCICSKVWHSCKHPPIFFLWRCWYWNLYTVIHN